MSELVSLILNYPFLQNALAASVLTALACGVAGTLTVTNRLTFLAGGASHAAYGGVGLALFFGLPVLPCTLAFSVLASMLMAWSALRRGDFSAERTAADEASVGVLWAAGMALGIVLMALTPGYAGELSGFLFGSILTVPGSDLWITAAFDVSLLLVLLFFRQGLWAFSLDPDFAAAKGLPVRRLYMLLVAITAAGVVLLIRTAGLILVLALLTIPPYIARGFCRSLYGVMLLSFLLSLAFSLCGLVLSWHTNLPSGAAVIAVAVGTHLLVGMARAAYSTIKT